MTEPKDVRALSCPSCGGQLKLRAPAHTETVGCVHCKAVLDVSDENAKIIDEYQKKMHYKPLIPVGARGKFRGDEFEVIGFMVRHTSVEGESYYWDEYLLFNPFKGFRWLTQYAGHWNFVENLQDLPKKL